MYLNRLQNMLRQLQSGIYEKETELSLSLLAALAGESVLLLGPPGVAKSMVARRLKEAFKGATSFEYLMSRFSTPDELFGPVSIARLKENDAYERATAGYLPTADVAFLDEIWKAGPAIQNTLLTILNERLFRNGAQEVRVPLKLLIAASNELPAKGEGLEALWDRFLVRIVSGCIKSESVFREMLCAVGKKGEAGEDNDATCGASMEIEGFTPEEYARFQEQASSIPLSKGLLDAITATRQRLQRIDLEGSDLARRIYISDRRWMHLARLLRTEALALDRPSATPDLLLPLYHCLWNEPDEIEAVRHIVIEAVMLPVQQALNKLSAAVKSDLRAIRAKEALAKAVRDGDRRDVNLEIVDRFFYQIENHGTGHTCVFITDFKRMPMRSVKNAPAQGIIYDDPSQRGRKIVRLFDPDAQLSTVEQHMERVTLCRGEAHIYINGVSFKMREKGRATMAPAEGQLGGLFAQPLPSPATPISSDTYEAQAEQICTDADALALNAAANIFVDEATMKAIDAHHLAIMKQVAQVRVDIRKLLYEEE